MNILLATHQLNQVGGTERFTADMAHALHRKGLAVTVFSFVDGWSAQQMRAEGLEVTHVRPLDTPDAIWLNHHTCLAAFTYDPCPVIHTSHGPWHSLEFPIPGADAYVGVSQEIADTYPQRAMTVIGNGVDLTRFQPTPLPGDGTVLSLCKNRAAGALVAEACQRQGRPFQGVYYEEAPVWDVAPLIAQADIVVGSGRSALEGLALNRPTLVFDVRGKDRGPRADGWLTPETIDAYRYANCSTRTGDHQWLVEDLEKALYIPPDGTWGRAWVEEHANLSRQVDAYLALTEQIYERSNEETAQVA